MKTSLNKISRQIFKKTSKKQKAKMIKNKNLLKKAKNLPNNHLLYKPIIKVNKANKVNK